MLRLGFGEAKLFRCDLLPANFLPTLFLAARWRVSAALRPHPALRSESQPGLVAQLLQGARSMVLAVPKTESQDEAQVNSERKLKPWLVDFSSRTIMEL